VHTRSSYRAEEIVWNARFQSIFRETDGDTRTQLSVDVSRVHDIEPTPGTASQGSGLRAQG
jgi:hypothetical protein